MKNEKKSDLGSWAKMGLAYFLVGAGIFAGGLKIMDKYSTQKREYQSKIPIEYVSVNKQRDKINSLRGLEFANKLEDPNFVENYKYVIIKHHEYSKDPELSKNLEKIEDLELKQGCLGWPMMAFGFSSALVGAGTLIGTGISALNQKIKDREKHNGK